MVRYNADGSLDTTFGTGGKVLTPVGTGTSNDIGNSLTVQEDGKIIVAGYGGGSDGTDFAVVRYNADGSLDTTFGTGGTGKILTPVGAGTSNDFGNSVTVQADGKIVVAGYGASSQAGNDFAVVRYTANGTLDTTFGTGGKIVTPIGAGTSNDYAYSVTVQADGKIIVAGQGFGIGTSNDFAVVRYTANGTLDTTFGPGGTARSSPRSAPARILFKSVIVQADGKIVVAGYGQGSGTGYDFAVVRYNADGSLDTTFGLQSSLGGTVAFTENGAARHPRQRRHPLRCRTRRAAERRRRLCRRHADPRPPGRGGRERHVRLRRLDLHGLGQRPARHERDGLRHLHRHGRHAHRHLHRHERGHLGSRRGGSARRHLCQHLRRAGLVGHARLDVLGR